MNSQVNCGKRKVVHRQTFQNSNCVTELTVKTYPKPTKPIFSTPEPFVRECILQKEIERIEKEKKNVKNAATKKAAGIRKADDGEKGVGGSVTIEVTKKSRKKGKHPHIPDGGTWKDVLSQYSSASDHSRSGSGSEVVEAVMRSPQQQPRPSPPQPLFHQQHPQSATHPHPITKSSKYPSQIHLYPQSTDPSRQLPHHSTQPPTHQPQDRYFSSTQEQAVSQHTFHYSKCPPQHTGFPSMQAHLLLPVPQLSPQNPQSPAHPPEHTFHPGTHFSLPSPQPPTNISPPHLQHHTNHHTEPAETPLAPQQQRYPHLPQSSDPAKAPEQARLLSDNASTSPFGDSALQILHRLRMQLQTKGENECTDMVDAVEAIINGRGSLGGVGSKNQQPLATPHLQHHSVFPTPEPSYREHRTVENALTPASVMRDTTNNKEDEGRFPDVRTTHGRIDQLPLSTSVQGAENQNTSSPPHQSSSVSHTSCQQEIGVNNEDELLKVIEEHKEVIRKKDRAIFTLKTLSSQLINHQEILNKGGGVEVRSTASTKSSQPSHVGEPDSGLGGDNAPSITSERSLTHTDKAEEREETDKDDDDGRKAGGGGQIITMWQHKERDYMVRILDLQTENEALHQEIVRLQELIKNLEVQMTQKRDHLSQQHCSKFSHASVQAGKRKKVVNTSTYPASDSSTQSNADSAYEEKTGSHLTSKTSSPYSDRPHPPVATSVPQQLVAKRQHRKCERSKSRAQKKDEEISDTGSSNSKRNQPAQFTINPSRPSPKPEQQSSINPTLSPPKLKTHGVTVTPLSVPDVDIPAATTKDTQLWGAPHDVGFSSFSTASDYHIHDSKVSPESSFLKGIRAPRQSRNTDAERSVFPISAGLSETPHLPLESTRVQDVSPYKLMSRSEGETMSMEVNSRHSTSTPLHSVIETLY
ncbi:hypothetical protein Pmani_011623 [Petrolisthes manimaculis]|uniref:Uncharacterized protein n=1 Tax=Petrolisthes manimaculis TaxID=1843537 RepID=A0AAE1UB08_9EUCA|nr:hypothetical protein Pmani_011623 [Petrolisthes manimaculis]